MQVIGYMRVEENKNNTDEHFVDNQTNNILDYALKSNLQLSKIFTDRNVSGRVWLSERPKGSALLETIKRGDTLIVDSLDRLAQDSADLVSILEFIDSKKIELHILELGGKLEDNVIQILNIVSRSLLSTGRRSAGKKLKENIKQKRNAGKFVGGTVPFGYKLSDEGKLIEDAAQQKIIEIILKKRKEGLSFRSLSDFMLSKHDIKLSTSGIRNIIVANNRS